MKSRILVTLIASAFLASAPAMAKDKKQNRGEEGKVTPAAQAVSDIAVGNQLAAYGIAKKDPLALITAAKILKANPVAPGTAKKDGKAGEAVSGAEFSADALLDQAKAAAGDRKDLVALADDVRAQGSRGKVGGAAQVYDAVNPRTVDTWPIRFRGGEQAIVTVRGARGVDIDCYVYDENGNLIDSDADSTSTCVLAWYPKWTGEFRVRVRNPSDSRVEYELTTN